MAFTLFNTRLRMTQAKYFGKYNVASGTVTSIAQGSGITMTPNPTITTGVVSLGTLTAPWNAGNYNISSKNSVDVHNVVAYGADPTGVADSTAAIQSAITAACATTPNGTVYFPSGTFKTTGLYDLSGQSGLQIVGSGFGTTVIDLNHATNDLFYITSPTSNLMIKGFTVNSLTAVRTAGWVFHVNTLYTVPGALSASVFEDIEVENQFNGFWLAQYWFVQFSRVIGYNWAAGAGGGVGFKFGQTTGPVDVNQGAEAYLSYSGVDGATTGVPTLSYGLWIEDCEAVYCVRSGFGGTLENNIRIVGNTGGHACQNHIFTSGSVSDTTRNSHGVYITGTGAVTHVKFDDCWFASAGTLAGGSANANGVRVDVTAFGESEFVGCNFYGNKGTGLYLNPNAGAGSAFCNITGCNFDMNGSGAQANNNDGIYVGIAAGGYSPVITGCAETGSNGAWIRTSATADTVAVSNNLCSRPPAFGTEPLGSYFVNGNTDLRFRGNVGIGGNPNFLLGLGSGVADTKLAVFDDGISSHGIGSQAGLFRFNLYNAGGQRYGFFDGTTNELLTITSSGGVGINTSAPTRFLDVNGEQRWRGIAAPAVSEANSATMYFDSATNTLKASLNGSAYVNVIGSAGLTGSGTATKIGYWTGATVLAGAANIYTDATNHRLGVKVAAPAYTLDVDGDINVTTGSVIRVNALRAIVSDATNDITLLGSDLPAAPGANTTAVGALAAALVTGTGNTAFGRNALGGTTTGQSNVALGMDAGQANTTGNDNLFLGTNAGASAGNLQRATAIGHDANVAANDSMVLGDGSVKVGIHTSTPAQALDVNGAVATRHLDIVLVNGANTDIALTDSSWIRFTGPTGAFSINGFTGGTDGRRLTVFNTTTEQMTITNLATSAANNQIDTLTGADVVLAARKSSATFIYEDASDKWILVGWNG